MSTPCRECGHPELTNEEVEALYARISELSAELVEARGALARLREWVRRADEQLQERVDGIVGEDNVCENCGEEMATEEDHDSDPAHLSWCHVPKVCALLKEAEPDVRIAREALRALSAPERTWEPTTNTGGTGG